MSEKNMFFVGCYAEKEQISVQGLCLNKISDGKMELIPQLKGTGISNPSYVTASENGQFIYTVMEDMTYECKLGGGEAALKIEDGNIKLINTSGTKGTLPCHILLDEQRGYLYVANYLGGSIAMFRIGENGQIIEMCDFHQLTGAGPNQERQEKSHVHFLGFTADRNGIWAVDLGDDKVKYYTIDQNNSKLMPQEECDIVMPAGVGPRHFVQNGNNKYIMYIICELSSEVYVVECGEHVNKILQSVSTLPEGTKNSTCAAIHISVDNKFLYASNRGDDSVAVYKIKEDYTLELLEIVKSGGRTPRDFCVVDDFLICANQDSNLITVLHRDKNTGKLTNTDCSYKCKSPVCIINKL